MHIDYLLMLFLFLFLSLTVLYKFKYHSEGNPYFFDIETTKAMRGFWSIIVVLVHIPVLYQNKLQDAIGSFAYIGVTFFFLTSAYGLVLKAKKGHGNTLYFWLIRLLKLIVPQIVANIFFDILFYIVSGNPISFFSIFHINRWVIWLLICYFLFYISFQKIPRKDMSLTVLISIIAIISISFFLLKTKGCTIQVWTTEMWGFIWGCLLALYFKRFVSFFQKNWLIKCIVFCMITVGLGLSYITFKTIVFWGSYVLKILLGLAITSFLLLLNVRFSIGNKLNSFLGTISYETYLIHGSVFHLLELTCSDLGSGVFIVLSIFTTIFFSTIIHYTSTKIQKILYQYLPLSKR